MALPDVLAAQDLLQRAFGDAVRQRTGRLAGPPFGPRLAMVRFQKEPPGAFIALRGGRVVGCVFSVRWGSLAYFGPIAVAPEAQRLGIAQRLIDAVHGRWRRARGRLSCAPTVWRYRWRPSVAPAALAARRRCCVACGRWRWNGSSRTCGSA